jgi:predicted chitinase
MAVLQKFLAQFLKESSGFFIAQVSIQRLLRQWNRAVFEAKKV